jgi:hypothetical protein
MRILSTVHRLFTQPFELPIASLSTTSVSDWAVFDKLKQFGVGDNTKQGCNLSRQATDQPSGSF